MTSVNISNFRANLYGYADNIIKLGDIVDVRTKNGDFIAMNKDDYNGIMETLYLMQFPGTMEEIKEGIEKDLNDEDYWVSEDEVNF